MRETWYVLEDGTHADPREVAPDDNGVLRHSSGVFVGIGSHGNPLSTGVDVDEEGGEPKESVKAKQSHSPNNRQMKAEADSKKYKTR